MNQKKQQHFKGLLMSIRQKLTEDVKRCLDTSKEEVSGGVPDIMDDAARTYSRQVILNLSEKERAQLGRVDEALQKIADGQYGTCEECEAHIPLERLDIIPFAKFCVECESKMEEKP